MSLLEFTSSEVIALREVLAAQKGQSIQKLSSPLEEELDQASDIYIAYPESASGIPGMVEDPPGTFTPGTDTALIYKINADEELELVSQLSKKVYNLSTTAVPQVHVPVFKTKFGKWIIPNDETSTDGGGDGVRCLYGVATENWRKAGDTSQSPTPQSPYVVVNPCDDIEGNGIDTGTTHVVRFANFYATAGTGTGVTNTDAQDPNVEKDQVICYGIGPDDLYCTSGYYDGKILDAHFSLREQPDKKQGWGRMDSSSNGTANGGSNITMVCRFPRGQYADTAPDGADEGTETHYHEWEMDGTTPVTEEEGSLPFNFGSQDGVLWRGCTTRHMDTDDCTCGEGSSPCDDDPDGCAVPVLYKYIHYLERLDNSQTRIDAA
jgi:hypothetical protein